MKNILVKVLPDLASNPRLNYTFDFINNHPLCRGKLYLSQDDSIEHHDTISYGLPEDTHWHMPCQKLFFDQGNERLESIFLNEYTYEHGNIYSVEKLKSKGAHVISDKYFEFDLIEAIFFHISRYEEVFAFAQDHNSSLWLREEKQILVKTKLEKTPVVDHLVKALVETLTSQKIDFATSHSLSHDIDLLYRFRPFYKIPKTILGILWHRRGLAHLIKTKIAVFKYLLGLEKDPYDVYKCLFSKCQIEKTCYFMAGGETTYDNNYRITDPKVKALISLLHERNYTIGIHPSYNASIKENLFQQEVEKLNDITKTKISHSRQHCLRWNWEVTPYIIESQGIIQDSSLGYNRRIGFRCGTGYAYNLYDFKNERAFRFKELPMSFMESSLIHEANNDIEQLSSIFRLFFQINISNTHIESNWHNSNFDKTMWFGETLKSLYQQYIDQCAS